MNRVRPVARPDSRRAATISGRPGVQAPGRRGRSGRPAAGGRRAGRGPPGRRPAPAARRPARAPAPRPPAAAALPDGEVGVLHGQLGQERRRASREGWIEGRDLPHQHAHRPAVADDVVDGEDRQVRSSSRRRSSAAQQRPAGEVERPPRLAGGQPLRQFAPVRPPAGSAGPPPGGLRRCADGSPARGPRARPRRWCAGPRGGGRSRAGSPPAPPRSSRPAISRAAGML